MTTDLPVSAPTPFADTARTFTLLPGTVWLLLVDVGEDAQLDAMTDWLKVLSDSECQQVARLKRPSDRRAKTAAHALKRLALAAIRQCSPEQLHFSALPSGKPCLVDGPAFNLSHTQGQVALAIAAAGMEVGVDIEHRLRPRVDRELAVTAFGEQVAATLPDERNEHFAEAFFHQWTCREAVAKADGQGLGIGLERIQLHSEGQAFSAQVDQQQWRLYCQDVSPCHRLALAIAGVAERDVNVVTLSARQLSNWCDDLHWLSGANLHSCQSRLKTVHSSANSFFCQGRLPAL